MQGSLHAVRQFRRWLSSWKPRLSSEAVSLRCNQKVGPSFVEPVGKRGITADGGNEPTSSSKTDVDDAMKKAESAYSAGDYRITFTIYQKAFALDPTLYDAAVFSGDTYLHTPVVDSAYVWYARATEIHPNRETAWRYWC